MRPRVRFDEEVVIVTGAGRGIGLSTAQLIASLGGRVLAIDAGVDQRGRQPKSSVVEKAASEIRRRGGSVVGLHLDLAKRAAAEEAVEICLAQFGTVNALVHLAGVSAPAAIEEVADATLENLVAINALAAFRLCRSVFPVLRKAAGGRIVLTTSGHAFSHEPGDPQDLPAYALGKGAQLGLAMALAAAGRPHNILVNALSPVAATRMYRSRVAQGTFTPEQVAGVAVWLASTACSRSGLIVRTGNGFISLGEVAAREVADLGPDASDPDHVAAAMESYLSGA